MSSCSARRSRARASAGCIPRSRTCTRPWWRRFTSTAVSTWRKDFVERTLIPRMTRDYGRQAREPEVDAAREVADRGHHAHVQARRDAGPAARPHLRRAGVRGRPGPCAGHGPHEEGSREPGGEEHAGVEASSSSSSARPRRRPSQGREEGEATPRAKTARAAAKGWRQQPGHRRGTMPPSARRKASAKVDPPVATRAARWASRVYLKSLRA